MASSLRSGGVLVHQWKKSHASRTSAGIRRSAGAVSGFSSSTSRTSGLSARCSVKPGQREREGTFATRQVPSPVEEEDAVELSFLQRLFKAWEVLFPPKSKPQSVAEIAKERLRLVLYSDRGTVSNEIRARLREHIIDAISTYVEIESEDDVQLVVSAEPAIGTVYSVTVPVRRVKPEFQEYWGEGGFRDRVYEEMVRIERSDGFGMKEIEAELRFETSVIPDKSKKPSSRDGTPE